MTITKSGALASFYTVNKAPIKHLRVYFSPKQAGEGDPSPENVREIEGINYITVYSKGTSIIDFTNSTGVVRWYVPENFLGKSVIYYGLIDNTLGTTTIKLSLRIRDANNISLGTYYSAQTVAPGEYKNIWAIFNIPTQANNIQLSVSNVTSNTIVKERGLWLYNAEDSITIDFDSSIYGGYVDLVTGELVETHVKRNIENFSSIQIVEHASGNIFNIRHWIEDMSIPGAHGYWEKGAGVYTSISDIFHDREQSSGPIWEDYGMQGVSNSSNLYIKDSAISTTDEFINKYTGHYIVYNLNKQITYQLTPTQLQTLIGQNNIWSNADRVEVEYDLAESNDELYRRRNILLRTPHIEPAAGSIASFNTDMQAQLKECKVHFAPVQEGEGDPSLDNVRPISGWTGVNLYHSSNTVIKTSNNNNWELGYLGATGRIAQDKSYRTSDYFKVNTDDAINLSFVNNTTERPWYGFAVYDAQKNFINRSAQGYSDAIRKVLNYSDIAYARLSLNIASNIMCYVEPITTIPIDWPSEAGTIYGGYANLVTREIVEEWASIVINGTENWATQAPHGDFARIFLCNPTNSTMLGYASILSPNGVTDWIDTVKTSSDEKANGRLCCRFGWVDKNFYILNAVENIEGVSDITSLKSYLSQHPLHIVYKLAEPIHYSIDPITLKTLRGTNNIWSNANGPIELSYWKH